MAGQIDPAREGALGVAGPPSGVLKTLIDRLGREGAAGALTRSADVALVIDDRGVIRDVVCSDQQLSSSLANTWRGRPWVQTVTHDSRDKVSALLRDAATSGAVRWREVNHHGPNGTHVPIRYSAMPLGQDGLVFAIGRDLRDLGRLQERLVDAQRALDVVAKRLRHADARYRLLFEQASEALLIVNPNDGRVLDANPAVGHLAGISHARVIGQPVLSLFHDTSTATVSALLAAVQVSGRTESRAAQLLTGNSALTVSASRLRSDDEVHLIVRLMPPDLPEPSASEQRRTSQVLATLDSLPFGFVVTDGALRIVKTNAAFRAEIGAGGEAEVVGAPLARWLGRREGPLDGIVAGLKESSTAIDFAGLLRTGPGGRPVTVTAVGVTGEAACFGFVIARGARTSEVAGTEITALPRSSNQLAALLGQMSLKDIIAEAVECIEKLSIEAALRQTRNNRASAANLLGLSRQSLYVKLRRYGLADFTGEDSLTTH